MADIPELVNILRESREYLRREDSDYSWSSWEDEQAANAEIDEIIEGLMAGGSPPEVLHVIFAPTGPMQEVSLSSGWGHEFLDLASRFDRAMASEICACTEFRNITLEKVLNLGMDKFYGEVSLLKCSTCGQLWMHYLYENESISGSGRWFECQISEDEERLLTANSAMNVLNSKPWFWQGGSYFDGLVSRSEPPVILN